MSSTPTIRVYTSTSPEHRGTRVAIGRSHASWFVCFPRPYATSHRRVSECLNTIIPTDASTLPPPGPNGNARFVVEGRMALDTLARTLKLKDENGAPPLRVVSRSSTRAVVEVLVPTEEQMQVCAHCGMWERSGRARFQRCGGCRARYYCSAECQKGDWKPAWHKGECALLKEGKAFEVEQRRQLHDNEWFMSGMLRRYGGDDGSEKTVEEAEAEGDIDFLIFGELSTPRDVAAKKSFEGRLSKYTYMDYINGVEVDLRQDGVVPPWERT